jgi:transcriptional regulator with XRE-family HTH domain
MVLLRAKILTMNEGQEIGQRIREAREARSLSMNALAKLVGTRHGHISLLESGGIPKPSVGLITRIADALEVPLDSLLGRKEYNPASELTDEPPDRIKELSQLTQVHDPARVEKLLRMAEGMSDKEYEDLLRLVERFAAIRQEERLLNEEIEQGRVRRPGEPPSGDVAEVG